MKTVGGEVVSGVSPGLSHTILHGGATVMRVCEMCPLSTQTSCSVSLALQAPLLRLQTGAQPGWGKAGWGGGQAFRHTALRPEQTCVHRPCSCPRCPPSGLCPL